MNKLLLSVAFAASCAAAVSAETGLASIKGTADGSKISGTVSFTDTPAGLKLVAALHGLTPGAHGFHIHESGSCEDLGKAAGGHYNPAHAPHGEALKNPEKAHAGDAGNIVADDKGDASLTAVLPKVTLSGEKLSVAGRAVIVHEKADDFSQPTGNAGGRAGCGVIGLIAPVQASITPAPAAAAPVVPLAPTKP